MNYTIMIDEDQRARILDALLRIDEGSDDELATLVRMFEILPDEEAAAPGTLHGFCL